MLQITKFALKDATCSLLLPKTKPNYSNAQTVWLLNNCQASKCQLHYPFVMIFTIKCNKNNNCGKTPRQTLSEA